MERLKQTLRSGRWACPRGFAKCPRFCCRDSHIDFPSVLRRWRSKPPDVKLSSRCRSSGPNKNGVTRYRLQIAADEKFQDVFFDGRVAGSRYLVSDLSPGYYYWRVAPADSESPRFSRPSRFFVSGGVVKTVRVRGTGGRLVTGSGEWRPESLGFVRKVRRCGLSFGY